MVVRWAKALWQTIRARRRPELMPARQAFTEIRRMLKGKKKNELIRMLLGSYAENARLTTELARRKK